MTSTAASSTAFPESISSSGRVKSYALVGALGADVDLIADGGQVCRRIRVGQAGNLTVQDREGDDVTIPSMLAGETIEINARTIRATSTAQKLTVMW